MKDAPMIILILFYIQLCLNSTSAQIEWTKYPDNPVLDVGLPGSWDQTYVLYPSVIFDGTTYHMWYSGLSNYDWINICTGYATSEDGIEWSKYSGNPVIDIVPAGSWNSNHILAGPVLRIDSTLMMWYSANEADYTPVHTGLAISTNGISWKLYDDTSTSEIQFKHSDPVLSPISASWEGRWALASSVLYEGGIYKMWYLGEDWQGKRRVGYATSQDGIHWIKYNDPTTTDLFYYGSDPVLDIGPPGSWDEKVIMKVSVISNQDQYQMWYGAGDEHLYIKTGYATSQDGIHWVKYDDPSTKEPPFSESDPVMDLGPSGAWDDTRACMNCVILQDSIYKMWYHGFSSAKMRIGYATSRVVSSTQLETKLHALPKKFSLYQNYPNPFNASTVLSWQLAVDSDVDLSVYNTLGQKVVTLVRRKQKAGFHTERWDADKMASGVYYYRLRVADASHQWDIFQEIKTMVLIR